MSQSTTMQRTRAHAEFQASQRSRGFLQLIVTFCLLAAAVTGEADAQLRVEFETEQRLEVAAGDELSAGDLRIFVGGGFLATPLFEDFATLALGFTLINDAGSVRPGFVVQRDVLIIDCRMAIQVPPVEAFFDCHFQGGGLVIESYLRPGSYRLFAAVDHVSFYLNGPNDPIGFYGLTVSTDQVESFQCGDMIGLRVAHQFCAQSSQAFPVVELAQVVVEDPNESLPDLSFEGSPGLTVEGDVFPGSHVVVEGTVVNTGASSAGHAFVEFRLTNPAQTDLFARQILLLRGLGPGQSHLLRWPLSVPAHLAAGQEVWAEGRIDFMDRVPERDENNNFEDLQKFLTAVPSCVFADCSLSVSTGRALSEFRFKAHPGPVGCEAPLGVAYKWFTRSPGGSWGVPKKTGNDPTLDVLITPLNATGMEVRVEMTYGSQTCSAEDRIGGININL